MFFQPSVPLLLVVSISCNAATCHFNFWPISETGLLQQVVCGPAHTIFFPTGCHAQHFGQNQINFMAAPFWSK